jgi:hypothetical protein
MSQTHTIIVLCGTKSVLQWTTSRKLPTCMWPQFLTIFGAINSNTVEPRLSELEVQRQMQGQSTNCGHVPGLRMRSKPTSHICHMTAAWLPSLVLTLK